MHVVIAPFKPSKLFASIQWKPRRQLWDPARYRALVQQDASGFPPSARTLLQDSISSESPLFKASIARLTAEQSQNVAGEVDLFLELIARDGTRHFRIAYQAVTTLRCSGIHEFFVGGELLGHELTHSPAGWRHALLFIANEYVVVECHSVEYQAPSSEA